MGLIDQPNALTKAWVSILDSEDNSVLSGAGVWLVLSALLAGATGPACHELEASVGVTKAEAAAGARRLLHLLGSADGLLGSGGIWTRSDVPVRPDFAAALAPFTVAPLPQDMAELDRWAEGATNGLIRQFPLTVGQETLLVVASALAAEADWASPYDDTFGDWQRNDRPSRWLERTTVEPDDAAIIAGGSTTVSRLVSPTTAGFDVHLLAGAEGDSPGAVLGVGIDAVSGAIAEIRLGSRLRVGDTGPCLEVTEESATRRARRLRASLPAFEIDTDHDLMKNSALFGVEAARDTTKGHFPDLSPRELAVDAAAQSAMARFSATGFQAAAVTAFGAVASSIRKPPRRKAVVIRLNFDRPFGFLVVDRASGLVAFAGWVASVPEA